VTKRKHGGESTPPSELKPLSSRKKKQNRSYPMQTSEHVLNRNHIVEEVTLLLRRLGVVKDDEWVKDIQFSNLFGESGEELTKIKIFKYKEQEVNVLDHNVRQKAKA
jgi:hypothetical protein